MITVKSLDTAGAKTAVHDTLHLFGGGAYYDESKQRWNCHFAQGDILQIYVDGELLTYLVQDGTNALRDDAPFLKRAVNPTNVAREIKRQLYHAMVYLTKRHFPWGALTGIRPTYMAAEHLKTLGSSELPGFLELEYGLSSAKAVLVTEVAAAEQEIMQTFSCDANLLYVGVPFCPTRCAYCSFISVATKSDEAVLQRYVDAVCQELELVFEGRQRYIEAIYFGGGTPTILPPKALERIFATIKKVAKLAPTLEWTLEAGRPETIQKETLKTLANHQINAICLNPQTMHDHTLDQIGRRHTVADIYRAYDEVRQFAPTVEVNMDLILGLPGEDKAMQLASVDRVIAMQPERITLHTLALKRASRLNLEGEREGRRSQLAPRDSLIETMESCQNKLRQAGYAPYYLYKQKNAMSALENVGFAKAGCYSKYNVGMMSDKLQVIGIGSGSTSKGYDGTVTTRQINPKDPQTYMSKIKLLAEQKRHVLVD